MKEEPNLFDEVVEENEVYPDELPKKRQKRSHGWLSNAFSHQDESKL
jgi:hypothetical protein